MLYKKVYSKTIELVSGLLLVLFLLFGVNAKGQSSSSFPVIGKPAPYFELKNVNYYDKSSISSIDLLGKWYILDFWIMGCIPCIESFPKTNELVKKFKNKVEIIQVGVGGNELKQFYERLKKGKSWEIPMAFDLSLASKWQVNAYPKIFIVDDKGILRAITHEISKEKLEKLVDENKNKFVSDSHKEYKKVDHNALYFLNNNGGSDTMFLFRSVFAKGDSSYSSTGIPNLNSLNNQKLISTKDLKRGRFQLINYPLIAFYNVAYFGQFFPPSFSDSLYKEAVLYPTLYDGMLPMPILEIADSTAFMFDRKSVKGVYSYSLSVPKEKASKELIMRSIQLDLEKFFGYKAKVEERERDVWKLIIKDRSLVESLRSKRPTKIDELKNYRLKLNNAAVRDLLYNIYYSNPYPLPFFDETGIEYPIDIELDIPPGKIAAIAMNLHKHGLDLIKGTKKMKVLVIRDPEL